MLKEVKTCDVVESTFPLFQTEIKIIYFGCNEEALFKPERR